MLLDWALPDVEAGRVSMEGGGVGGGIVGGLGRVTCWVIWDSSLEVMARRGDEAPDVVFRYLRGRTACPGQSLVLAIKLKECSNLKLPSQ